MSRNYDNIIESIKEIDTDSIKKWTSNKPKLNIAEEQKVYFWIRLYLKKEFEDIKEGDDVLITYVPSGEVLETKFIAYSKKGLGTERAKELDHELLQYESEDDKRVLCLMIDEKVVNYSDKIPFIRTLFKNGRYYEYQLMRRDDLTFTTSDGNVLEYFEVDF